MQTRNYILLAAAALLAAPLLPASPIMGGSCRTGGTLLEFIELGSTGCYLSLGDRIYDISVDLPAPEDLSTIIVSSGPSTLYPWETEVTAHFFPIGAVLTVHWVSPTWGVMAEGYQFNDAGNLALSPIITLDSVFAKPGTITMQADVQAAYLGFRLEQLVPEPSAFLPLLGIGLLCGIR